MNFFATADRWLFHAINRLELPGFLERALEGVANQGWMLVPLLVALVVFALRQGARGRQCLLCLALALFVANQFGADPLKRAFDRPRPFLTEPDTVVRIGRGGSASMPSSHAVNCATIATVAGLAFPATLWITVPLVLLVGFTRVYLGVHYPADVLVGFAVGIGSAGAVTWAVRALTPVFSRWLSRGLPQDSTGRTPDLWKPESPAWTRLAVIVLSLLFVARLIYLGTGSLELSEDEAYQWLWSKHLDWSYFSKPPFVAVGQWIGTQIWGDTELGVRFLSPVIAFFLGLGILRFMTEATAARTAFWFVLVVTATPLMSVGSTLFTIDPLAVFFWMLAVLAGWRAFQTDSLSAWVWTGLGMAGGFLSKYMAPFQWACFALVFATCPQTRPLLRRRGPWIALAISCAGVLPVLIWNAQHGWIGVRHLEDRGGLSEAWRPTLRFFGDFLGAEVGLLNPVFFLGIVWALVKFFRADPRSAPREATDAFRQRYLLCQGLPVFLFYLAFTFRARVQPNWIAVSVLPLLMFATIVWQRAFESGSRVPRRLLIAGLALGLPIVIVLHETRIVQKLTGVAVPAKLNPLRRVRGYRELARIVGEQHHRLQSEGPSVFIITDHYGRAGLLSFYLPEARPRVNQNPLVTVISSDRPENQFWFWPEYRYADRRGQNALFVREARAGQTSTPPERLTREFRDVKSLGVFDVPYRGETFHQVELYACRDKL